MINVYFESDGYAELTATFTHEEDYNTLATVLEVMAKERGFDRVTESVVA